MNLDFTFAVLCFCLTIIVIVAIQRDNSMVAAKALDVISRLIDKFKFK